jgi:glycosyltransferase involved in cell wall biosynthesis
MRTSLILPALNEAESLAILLAEIPPSLVDQVIVVDNGSTDRTAQVGRDFGALVVSEPRRGYGYACAAGSLAAGGEVLVYIDGDGSFLPAELPSLVDPIRKDQADLVLGSRLLGELQPGAMPAHQHFGNWLVSRVFSLLYGVQITDLGPFRAIARDLLLSLEMRELTYGWPVEMMVKTARQGKTILEVPVTCQPRTAGRSKVGGTILGSVLATYHILRVVGRYAWRR